jgi:hypothetical protein
MLSKNVLEFRRIQNICYGVAFLNPDSPSGDNPEKVSRDANLLHLPKLTIPGKVA